MPIQDTTDAELARRCRAGRPEAWRELVRRHSEMVHRLAVRLLGAGADADDAFQETFLRVRRSFDSFDATRPLKPWISRIAYNVCMRRLGATSRRLTEVAEPEQLDALPDERELGPEARAARGEVGAIVLDAVDGLAAEDRAIVLMRYREGMSVAEVAAATDLPVNTVKTRLYRARGKLRDALAPLLGD